MADTVRGRATLLSLFADNVTGQISEQDLRDYLISIMSEDNGVAGDFWNTPQAKYHYTDKTAYGNTLHSQFIQEACSFGNVLCMDASTGCWKLADGGDSALQGYLGLAMDSYTANESQADVLIEGLVCNSNFSTTFSREIGSPICLDQTGDGSIIIISVTSIASYIRLGAVVPSTPMSITSAASTSSFWYFRPEWTVISA